MTNLVPSQGLKVKSTRTTNSFPDWSATSQDQAKENGGSKVQNYIIISQRPQLSNVITGAKIPNEGTAINNIASSDNILTHQQFVCSQSHEIVGNNSKQFLLLTTSNQFVSNLKPNSISGTLNTQNLISNSPDTRSIVNSGNALQNSNGSISNINPCAIDNQLLTTWSKHMVNSVDSGSQNQLNPQSITTCCNSSNQVAQNISSVTNETTSVINNKSNMIVITTNHEVSNMGKMAHTNIIKDSSIASNSEISINNFGNTSLSKQNSNRSSNVPSQPLLTTNHQIFNFGEVLPTNVSNCLNYDLNTGMSLVNVGSMSLKKENSNVCPNISNQITPLVLTTSNQTENNFGTELPVNIPATSNPFLALVPISKPSNTSTNILLNILSDKATKSSAKKCTDRSSSSDEKYEIVNKVLLTSKESMVKDRLKKYKEQLKRREVIGDYFCPICQVYCGSTELLKEHKERADYICRICTEELVSHDELESHFEKHLLYECNICEDVFIGKKDLKRHQEEKHPDRKSFKCEICDKSFFRNKSLTDHIYNCHNYRNQKSFKCDVCGLSYKRAAMLKSHSITVHCAYEYVECKYCLKLILGPVKLRLHIKMVHIDSEHNRAAACKSCGKVFKTVKNLITHQKNRHEMAESLSELCGKSIKTKLEMQRHIKNEHSKNRTFTCKFCNKQFGGNKSLLRKHVNQEHRIRKEPSPVFCEICGKLFKTSMVLKNHKKIHSDERPYKCDICDATFRQKVALKTHSRVHSSIGVYNCLNCGMDFKWKQTLDKHVKKCKSEEETVDNC